jgi:predicted RNase H-like HicB family nuclease
MVTVEVELLTDQGNNAVVRLPDRKFPGVVIQGDTLSTLITATSEAIAALECNDAADAQEVLRDLAAQLREVRDRYEIALREHGIELPY